MNFLKKKVKKAFESFTSDDGPEEGSGGHGESFHSSSSGGGAEVIYLIIICIYMWVNNINTIRSIMKTITKVCKYYIQYQTFSNKYLHKDYIKDNVEYNLIIHFKWHTSFSPKKLFKGMVIFFLLHALLVSTHVMLCMA